LENFLFFIKRLCFATILVDSIWKQSCTFQEPRRSFCKLVLVDSLLKQSCSRFEAIKSQAKYQLIKLKNFQETRRFSCKLNFESSHCLFGNNVSFLAKGEYGILDGS